MPNAKKFSVRFSNIVSSALTECSTIANFDDVVKACSLALNIHQYSNEKHVISVIDDSTSGVVLTLKAE